MTFKRWTSLTLLGGLLGCSSLVPEPPGGPAPGGRLPVSRSEAPGPLNAGAVLIDRVYGMGRDAHAQGHLKLAGQRYERVLSMQPDHVGALNALGVIRAEDGRIAEALGLFMRARNLAPDKAHIHNNIGYTLLHEERLDEAEAALQRAQALAPDSIQTLKNQERLAQARAKQNRPVATDASSPHALVSAPPVAGVVTPVVVAVAPNVFELQVPRAIETARAVAPELATGGAPSRPDPTQPAHAPVRWADVPGVKLEVSNGVGLPRLARRTAQRLSQMGMGAARLTNAPTYREMHTQIEYLPGQQAAARALADRLPVPVDQVQVPVFTGSVHLRLVLGHDLAGRGIAAWSHEIRPASASAPANGQGT